MQVENGNGGVFNVDDNTYCSIAVDEALGNLCGGTDVAFRKVATAFFGFTQEDLDRLFPIEEKYIEIIEEGLVDGKCMDYAELRIYVLALGWERMVETGVHPTQAIQEAWSEARLMCEDYGVRL